MSSGNWQVLWSPSQQDKFITFGNEICLYKVTGSQESPPKAAGIRNQVIQLSDDTYASLVSVLTDIQYLKCVAWYPSSEPENLIAVGQANGRVLVTCIGSENNTSNFGISREFVPRHSRQCNSLAWNPVKNNLLAAGLDKVRNDVSLLVWDIKIQLSVRDSGNQEKRHSGVPGGKQSPVTVGAGYQGDPSAMANRPLAELSTSDPTLSMAWSLHDHNMLICGQAQKFLRVFDIRDATRPHNATVTKAVNGVCVDPHFEHRIASFSEGPPGVMCIWDDRYFEKPLMIMNQLNPVTAIAWSPTRSGLLATIGKESPIVQLYDIQHASVGSPAYGVVYETEPSFIERSVQPSRAAVSSFSWHPTQENHMLTISPSGHIQDCTIFERISVAWAPSSHLTWGCGKHLLECSQQPAESYVEQDISVKMKKRAFAGYGIEHQQMQDIAKIVADDPKLVKLWSWISHIFFICWF